MKKYFQVPWSLSDLGIILVSAAALILSGVFLAEYFEIKDLAEGKSWKIFLVLGFFVLQWVLALIPLIILTASKYKLKIKHFGFKKISVWKTIKLVLWGYFLYLAISFIITSLILYTEIKIPGYQIQERILPIFGEGTFSLVVAGIVIVLIGPFLEEVFFRGFLLRTLGNKMSTTLASIISALAFAAIHFQWGSIIPIFILGLIINTLVIRGRSLWPAIVFHIINNAIAFGIELLIIKDVISIENLS